MSRYREDCLERDDVWEEDKTGRQKGISCIKYSGVISNTTGRVTLNTPVGPNGGRHDDLRVSTDEWRLRFIEFSWIPRQDTFRLPATGLFRDINLVLSKLTRILHRQIVSPSVKCR